MKKVLLAAIVACMALATVPSHAEAGNGCRTVGDGPSAEIRCEYTAKAAQATLLDATPNTVQVFETHKAANGSNVTTKLYDCGADVCKAPPGTTLNTPVGATITMILGNADAPEGFCPVCGTVGFAQILETA